jgi:hypothetical protein
MFSYLVDPVILSNRCLLALIPAVDGKKTEGLANRHHFEKVDVYMGRKV